MKTAVRDQKTREGQNGYYQLTHIIPAIELFCNFCQTKAGLIRILGMIIYNIAIRFPIQFKVLKYLKLAK